MDNLKVIIEQNVDRLSNILNTYPKLPNGLTPDEIKFSPEYQKIKKEYEMWFDKLRAYNQEENKKRKANGTKHYTIVYGVKLSRMQEIFFGKWVVNNNIALNTLTPEQRTEIVNKFLSEKYPTE